MKNLILVAFLSILVLAGICSPSRAQQSFPLVCRGGDSMRFSAHPGNQQGTFNILGLFFQKGAGPTGPSGSRLAPGECSWLDRGMRSNEPDILQEQVGAGVNSAPWFSNLKTARGCWIFNVFNTNQGVMQITSEHPCNQID